MSGWTSEYVIEGVVMSCVAIVGIILNMTSVVFFSTIKQQRVFHRLLLILALIDTIHLVFSSLTFSLRHFSYTFATSGWYYLLPYSLPIAQTSLTASVYLTIAITVERYLSIMRPFTQYRTKWMKSSFIYAAPGILFSILFSLPNYFQLSTIQEEVYVMGNTQTEIHGNSSIWEDIMKQLENETMHDSSHLNVSTSSGQNITVRMEDNKMFFLGEIILRPDFKFAEYRDNPIYVKVYVMWLHLLFNTLIPLTILMTLNIIIYRKLSSGEFDRSRRASDPRQMRRSHESSLRQREQRLARISLLIVLIFIICHSIKNIPSMVEICGHDPRAIPIVSHVVEFGHLLIGINCSVNFLVYCIGSGRQVVRRLTSYSSSRRWSRRTQSSSRPGLSSQSSESYYFRSSYSSMRHKRETPETLHRSKSNY